MTTPRRPVSPPEYPFSARYMFFAAVLLALAVAAPASASAAPRLALDLGAPIDASTGAISDKVPSGVVAEVGADWVRVNCILGPWSSPNDNTPRGPNGWTWLQTYDYIVDTLMGQGLQVYMLIGAEAVHSGAPTINSEQWVSDFTVNFVAIVDHFKDRVRTYESFNEPNDWAGGSSAQFQPYWFAYSLQEIWLNVKYFAGHDQDPAWNVTLISGPLFSHDQDNGASYLNDVYYNGRNYWAWDWCRSTYGSYPLDGVGYHVYVAQGTTNSSTVTSSMNTNLSAIYNQLTSLEGSPSKKLWISEIGWSHDAVGEQGQATNLTTSMDYLLKDSRVELATWFTTQDWPGGPWGLYRTSGLSEADRKPAWQAYYDIAHDTGGGGPSCSYEGSSPRPAATGLVLAGLMVGAAGWIGRCRPQARIRLKRC